MNRYAYSGGVLRERWDDSTRLYTAFDATGAQTSQRAYTAAENSAADADAAALTARTNRTTIETALSDALTEMQTIIDTANNTINSNPAAHLKTIARAQRRVIRLLIGRLDGTA